MKTKNQPFVSLSDFYKAMPNLNFSDNMAEIEDWYQKIADEHSFLKSFWNGDCLDLKKFFGWRHKEQAFYDLPYFSLKYVKHFGLNSYDIFHQREHALDDALWLISSRFHQWEFETKGWTAY